MSARDRETTPTTRVGINGVSGQMGGTLVETANDRPDVTVTFGIAPDGSTSVPESSGPAAGIPVYTPADTETAIGEHDTDVIVDFSAPEATTELARAAADAGVPLVVGTTGFADSQLATLQETSDRVAILRAANFSRGIQALLGALEVALAALPGYDVEILETHHNRKQDAPSGTAATILETIAEHREFETVAGREGSQPRGDSEVGVFARRAGDVRGEHEVLLAGNDEVVTLRHRAEDRAVFAAGALDAAVWLADRAPGWYSLQDAFDGSTREPHAPGRERER